MPARTSRRSTLLALVLGCLLFLAGLVSTQHGAGSPGTAPSSPAVAGDPYAAPRVAAVHPARYGARTAGRATTVTRHRLAPFGPSGVVLVADRIASLTDRTASGPGDQLAVGSAVRGLSVSASSPARRGWAVAVAVGIPQHTCPARAPPAV